MWHRHRWVIVLLIMTCLLSACTSSTNKADESAPAKVEPIEQTGFSRVILTADAAKRLGIQTTPVSDTQVGGTLEKVVPYSAVFYDVHGATWVYTNPQPLTFVRGSVKVDSIDDEDRAILSDGPPTGTAVVTVGTPELYGTEFEGGES